MQRGIEMAERHDLDKIRAHNLTFSEKEFHELSLMLDNEVLASNTKLKEVYPAAWEFLNRMSYSVSHGTEDGWSSLL